MFFLWLPHTSAFAAAHTFSNAAAFYNTYGTGQIVFSDGAFYYSSRGKAGDPKGIRYGVAGQKFAMEMDGGKRYVTGIALDDGSGTGSCRRISYVKKDGYYYSLYQVSYDRLFERFRSRYPGTDFSSLMYNRRIRYQVDFYLCLVLNGTDQGTVTELDNGEVVFRGNVYQNPDQILKAADWSGSTRKALKNYFGIQLKVFQPSRWYVSYHKNDPAAGGSMKKQAFTYGKAGKLISCGFSRVITVKLEPGDTAWKGKKLKPVSTMLKSSFRGWSLSADGKKKYGDCAKVKNLTDQHNGIIHLYALWSPQKYTLPELNSDQYVFLGWSRKEVKILPADTDINTIGKLSILAPGKRFIPEKDTVLYAVWKVKKYRVEFRTPKTGAGDSKTIRSIRYGRTRILLIRELIERCEFAGARLNREIIRKGLT